MPDRPPGAARPALRRPGRRLLPLLFVAVVVLPLAGVAIVSLREYPPDGRVLEVEMLATGGTAAQLFWTDTFGFHGDDSAIVPLHQRPGEYERLRFPLPARPLQFLRFDPMNGPGEVRIRRMRLLDFEGRIVRTLDPIALTPLHQITEAMPEADGLRVVTTPNADDPMLLMRTGWLLAPPTWRSLRLLTPFSLTWVAAAVAVMIVVGVWLGVSPGSGPRPAFSAPSGLWLAALFAAVMWAKLALLQQYPLPMPFWDQWDGEAASLYIPYANGAATWRHMFMLHNEHRIFFSRILALELLQLNGQWDPLLQMVVNATLHAIAGVVLAAILWFAIGRRYLPLIAACIAIAFGAPFGAENTLAGFQSAFYFLVLFTVLAVWLMGMHRPGTARWLLGCLFAICCTFTVAGGILTMAPIGGLIVLQAIAAPREWRRAVVNLAALGVIGAVAYAAMPPPIPYHEYLKAASVFAFRVSFERSLAFPWINYPRALVLMWLPLTILGIVVLRRKLRTGTFEQIALAFGAWVVLQAAAVAYARGAGGAPPASRYQDVLCFGFIVNTMVLIWLLARARTRPWRIAASAALAVWFVAGVVGIKQVSEEMLATAARDRRVWMREHMRNVRSFIGTDNLQAFLQKRGPQELPYHSAPMLAAWLRHPYVRGILPAAVRQPLALAPAAGSGEPRPRTTVGGDVAPIFDSYTRDRGRGVDRFESAPLACASFPYLRFEVAGSARESGLRLALRDAAGGETEVRSPPRSPSGWRGAYARCPSGQFSVLAVDESPTSWLAFREPTEIARGSLAAEALIQQAWLAGLVAAALALAALVSEAQSAPVIAEPRAAGQDTRV